MTPSSFYLWERSKKHLDLKAHAVGLFDLSKYLFELDIVLFENRRIFVVVNR